MLTKILETIKKYEMINSGDKILVGVSGGPDSVALLHALHVMQEKLSIELHVAHLNHGFRGQEAREDAEYVESFARHLGLACTVEEYDVPSYIKKTALSPQEAARDIRYNFLRRVAEENSANKVATAHNANDQAETVLFNLLRGSGSDGLGGIPPVREGLYIRPLIETWRTDIEKYCIKNNLETRLDKSNLKTIYTRNKIRLELIPHLEKEFNPNLPKALVKTADILRAEDEYFEDIIIKVMKDLSRIEGNKLIIDLVSFIKMPLALKRRIVKKSFEQISDRSLEYKHIEEIIEFGLRGQTGSKIDLPGEYRALKNYNQLVFEKTDNELFYTFEYLLKVPGVTVINQINLTIKSEIITDSMVNLKNNGNEVYLDYDKMPHSVVVRNRTEGDVFSPIGIKGKKKLKDFLIDSKIPRNLRHTIPMLASGKEIIWVAGMRIGEKWKVTDQTSKILKLEII